MMTFSTFCRPTRGHVKLVLETDGEGTTSFRRSIVAGRGEEEYVSQYAVDDKTVTWGAYEDKLKSFGILVKARNFLVFQVRCPPRCSFSFSFNIALAAPPPFQQMI